VPRPSRTITGGGRYWFNILIDPWLSGTQSDVASWFSQQWHAFTPAVGSIAQVEELAREVEILSSRAFIQDLKHDRNNGDHAWDSETLIDAIVVSHEFTDHCHKETLLQCPPDIPVFATTKAAQLIQSWKHFRLVLDAPNFSGEQPDWKASSLPPLPEWLAIGKLVNEQDALYYHSAILITFDCKDKPRRKWSARYSNGDLNDLPPSDDSAEAVIYTPHGIDAAALEVLPRAKPRIEALALLHGLHDVAISRQQLNMGAHNGLKAQRLLRAKYWFGTHDEVKNGSGLVGWFLKRKVISLEDALKLEQEQAARRKEKERDIWKQNDGRRALDDVHFLDLENGKSMVLT